MPESENKALPDRDAVSFSPYRSIWSCPFAKQEAASFEQQI
jgi:hypothetical protein